MQIYDYSNLLTVIDNLDLEKKRIIHESEANERLILENLENDLFASGMLEDWAGLIKALKKAGVRGFPYPNGTSGIPQFEDNYKFVYPVHIGSSGYRSDYFALIPGDSESPNAVAYTQWSEGYGSDVKKDIFKSYDGKSEVRKVRVKTALIREFMKNYPEYREMKLKELYQKIGEKAEEVESLRQTIL